MPGKPVLIIRAEQQSALGEVARMKFEERLTKHLAARYPDLFPDPETAELRNRVRRGIRTAERYGIRTAGCVAGFIELQIEFGDAFEDSPDEEEARAILEDTTLPDQIKAQLLHECLTRRTGGRRVVAARPPQR